MSLSDSDSPIGNPESYLLHKIPNLISGLVPVDPGLVVLNMFLKIRTRYCCIEIFPRCSSLHQIDLRSKSLNLDGANFIPILFWYDGTHIARYVTELYESLYHILSVVISRRQSYIDLVFEGDIPSPVGQFIEDNFSGHVMSLLREDFDKYAEFC